MTSKHLLSLCRQFVMPLICVIVIVSNSAYAGSTNAPEPENTTAVGFPLIWKSSGFCNFNGGNGNGQTGLSIGPVALIGYMICNVQAVQELVCINEGVQTRTPLASWGANNTGSALNYGCVGSTFKSWIDTGFSYGSDQYARLNPTNFSERNQYFTQPSTINPDCGNVGTNQNEFVQGCSKPNIPANIPSNCGVYLSLIPNPCTVYQLTGVSVEDSWTFQLQPQECPC